MKFCLLGEKLTHSYSKEIHGKIADYDLVEVEPQNVENFVKNNDYDGFNVTIPYKETIIRYLDEISDEAKAIGSVNTVKKQNGRLLGFNTDCFGLSRLFDGVNVKGKKALILGSGGTYKTARYFLEKSGAARIDFVSRKGKINYGNVYDVLPDVEIIINCTPVGMFPNIYDSPVDLSRFNKLEFVADCVYNPLKTQLTLQAEKLGVKNANGLKMLVCQALKAEEIWTGKNCGLDFDKIVSQLKKQKGNIVLFGMPSCGKTAIGKVVAGITGRKFYDTDDLIIKKTGKIPSDIIKNSGERAFRDIESSVVKEIAGVSGAVISLGGGAVLREQNVSALKLNGKLIYIKRDLNLLSSANRPISQKTGIKELFNERKEIYNSVKDGEIINDGEINTVAKMVVKEYENSCN